jgi:hypothetical protein
MEMSRVSTDPLASQKEICSMGSVCLFSVTHFSAGGHAVALLIEALRYKSEGRGFDSRWCKWNF